MKNDKKKFKPIVLTNQDDVDDRKDVSHVISSPLKPAWDLKNVTHFSFVYFDYLLFIFREHSIPHSLQHLPLKSSVPTTPTVSVPPHLAPAIPLKSVVKAMMPFIPPPSPNLSIPPTSLPSRQP